MVRELILHTGLIPKQEISPKVIPLKLFIDHSREKSQETSRSGQSYGLKSSHVDRFQFSSSTKIFTQRSINIICEKTAHHI